MGMRGRCAETMLQGFSFLLLCLALPVHGQTQKSASGQKPQQADHTIRVNVGLVQTDVMVFDRQGRFVPDLKQEQFELKVDGVAQPISFFELVSAGTARDEEIWARAAGKPAPSAPQPQSTPGVAQEGRTLLFFLDDWHLSADSVLRARKAVLNVVDNSMGVSDRAAIFAASGQLGFLQQLTDNKAALHAALAKFNFQSEGVVEHVSFSMVGMFGQVFHGDVPLNEFQAALIDQGDRDVLQAIVEMMTGMTYEQMGKAMVAASDISNAEKMVRQRASSLAEVSAAMTERTLAALRNYIHSAAVLPGRKVIFYVSDGFAVQPQKSDVVSRMRQLTDAAANAGILIYSLDARGLIVGLPDAKSKRADMSGAMSRGYNAVLAAQDGLNALASDTGGRFLKNTNALDTAMTIALAEISRYYMLGWSVDPDMLQPGKYRGIQVAVKGRSDLNVQLRHGLMDLSQLVAKAPVRAEKAAPDAAAVDNELKQTLESPFIVSGLPVLLHAGYFFQPDKGQILAISYQVQPEDLEAGPGKDDAKIAVKGMIANEKGASVGGFNEGLSCPPNPTDPSKARNCVFRHSDLVAIPPGVYQVRVAARDARNGRVGSAWEWIEVPASQPGRISLSSIFLREQGGIAPVLSADTVMAGQFSVARRFTASSLASYCVSIYNAANADVEIETKIYNGNHVVAQSPPKALEPAKSQANGAMISYRDELPLKGLAAGFYILEVTAADRATKAAATQQTAFSIR